MNICLIGSSLTNLVLAKNLLDREINIDLYSKPAVGNSKVTRTIGISENNIDFFTNNKINLKKISWPIKDIKVFNEFDQKIEILNFESSNKTLFSLIKYKELFNNLNKLLEHKKNFNRYKIKKNSLNKIISNPKYDLIINSDKQNNITDKYSINFLNKDYSSKAYTTLIKHNYCKNNTAMQIFTKVGPMAFLPLSNSRTSVVFSVIDKSLNAKNVNFEEYIKKYNNYYKINSFSKIEKFQIKFSFARNYYHKNILLFGDALHQVHPLAGQGFNMTLRDIKILLSLIDEHTDLGLPLDKSLLLKFENKIKHFNLIFASGIDLIHEFFIFDSKVNNLFTKNVFKVLEDNKLFKYYVSKFANNGISF